MSKDIGLIVGGVISNLDDIDSSDVDIFEEVKMSDAGKLAAELEAAGTKAIITSHGIVSKIKKHVEIPVICATNTYFDLLETLRGMEEALNIKNQKIALILHSTRSIDIKRLQPFVNNAVSLLQYDDEKHLQQIILSSFSKEFKAIVGGPTTVYLAGQLNIPSFPLYLGQEAILTALEKTRTFISLMQKDREETQRLKTVLNSFSDGIIVNDRHGTVVMCNTKALNIINMQEDEVIGQKVQDLTGDTSWADIYQKGFSQIDVIWKYKNSSFFTSKQPIIVNGHTVGTVGTFQEVAKIEKLEHQYRKLQTLGLTAKHSLNDIIGESPAMKKAVQQAKAYAEAGSTILIEGETGTGKEMFAQSIHNMSPRKKGPFVAINCAALPANLLESELMGYEEGAFTGAKRGGKAGLFELAHKGTIFLDEVNQLPLQLQSRILRIIQEKVILRLGGERIIPVDVHIIAAANENLAKKVKMREFRDDLYYRLNILNLRLPPLRERLEDIPLLLKHFIKLFSAKYGLVKNFAKPSVDILQTYNWPGNIRELSNFIERYVIINQQSQISDKEYVEAFLNEINAVNLNCDDDAANFLKIQIGTLDNMEEQLIRQVLKRCANNKVLASLMLGVSRTTIWHKLKNK